MLRRLRSAPHGRTDNAKRTAKRNTKCETQNLKRRRNPNKEFNIMFTTKEEIINYCNRGEKMRAKFKQKIGNAFLQERLKRRLPLEQLSREIKIPAFKIETLELGYKKMNMCLIAALLKFYNCLLYTSPSPRD